MKKTFILLMLLSICSVGVCKPIRVLLIGDSTTVGAIPATCRPDQPHLSSLIEAIYNGQCDGEKIEVSYSAKGGESAATVIASGRYDDEIAPLAKQKFDIVIVRYGINDWYKCKDKDKDFVRDLNALWERLESDFSGSRFIAQTITPFLPDDEDQRMNGHIAAVAKARGIALHDLNTPYVEAMQRDGKNNYWVRQRSLSDIDECYHELVKPYTYNRGGKMVVLVDDNTLDALFYVEGKSGWVNHHPNSAGYLLMARESAKFLRDFIPGR